MKDFKNISFIIRNTTILVLVFWSTYLSGQSIHNGDSTTKWFGDLEAFVVSLDNSIQSKAINTTYLSAPNELAYSAIWEFDIELNFNPSPQNQLRLYLTSDHDSLKKPLNGYFILIGESGNTDRYHLYKQRGEEIHLLMSSAPKPRGNANQVKSRIKITRNHLGVWKLYTSNEDDIFIFDGDVKDDEFMSSSHFGLHCFFTPSNSNKFQFNYLNVKKWEEASENSIPPVVLSHEIVNNVSIALKFDKVLDTISAGLFSNYLLNPEYGSPSEVWVLDSTVNLSFADSLTTNNYELSITALKDTLGNLMSDTTLLFYYEAPEYSINTIPPAILAHEIIDSVSIAMKFDKRLDTTTAGILSNYILNPGYGNPSQLLIQDSILKLSFADSLTTNNYELSITALKDTLGNLMSDTTILFYYEAPKYPIDTIPPLILSHQIVDSVSIALKFDKVLDTITAGILSNYILNPNYGSPSEMWIQDSIVKLSFADSLTTDNYELNITTLKDTLGNSMSDTTILFYYEAPEYIEPEPSWVKLKTDLVDDFIVIDSFENTLSLWQGQLDKFHNPNRTVMNTDSSTSPSFVFLPNTEIRNRLWEAGVEIEGSITTQNNMRIYLAASQDSLPGNQKGYYLQLDGSSGKHQYKLYKQNNSSRTLLFQSESYETNPASLRTRIRVTNSIDGEWKIYASENDHEAFTLLETSNGDTSVVDATFDNALYSGWMTRFSSTRSQDYKLHYFLIKELEELPDEPIDTIPPVILSHQILDSVSIELTFNKALDTTSSLLSNYLLNPGYGAPAQVWVQDSIVHLSFADSLITNNYELNITALKDTLGNLMSDTTILFYYEAPEYLEPEPSWSKLKTDLVDDFIVIDSFENTLSLWQGQLDKFHNPNRTVMNTDSSTSPSFIFLPNRKIKNRLWEAGVEIEGSITTQNNMRIYLAASQDSLPGNQKGYYLQLDGGSGKHQYKLYKQNNSSRTLLFQSESYETNPASLRTRIRVTNSINGEWKIYVSENDHEAFTLLETSNGDTSIIDATFDNALYSGWMTRFSSTRSQDYRLHYFLIKQLEELPDEPIDTIPPEIISHEIIDSVSIALKFDKVLDTITAGILSNYTLNPGYGAPNQVWVQDSIVKLSFSDSLTTDNYELNITALKDTLGNSMSDTTILFYYEAPEQPLETFPLAILSYEIIDSISIALMFDKVLDTTTTSLLSNYILNPGYGNPSQLLIQDSTVKLSFADSLTTNNYELSITALKDTLGNLMSDTTILFYYEAPVVSEPIYNPLPYEVIINEIMADPKNSNGLPEIEYVELKNLTDKVIYLKDWTYQRPQTVYTFQDEKILPYSYLILYKESDSLHVANFGASAGLGTWPILVNSGALLTLKNREGIIIDQVDYNSTWYGDTQKAKGGWSLERIDDYNLCMDSENWKASTDPSGGTPGRENSIHQVNSILDLDITSAQIIDIGEIKVIFNKSIVPYSAKLTSNYSIKNSMGIPDSITIIDSESIVLNYSSDFLPGLYYQLTINNITDCLGTKATLQVEIFSAEAIEKNDLLINEILMNPYKDGVEFVEIYNNSMKKLDLTTLSLATARSSDNKYTTKTITKEAYILDPQKYLLLSNNSAMVAAHYPSSKVENFLEMESFPVLNNTAGTIVLLSKDKEIDRFDYHESMHDPLVVNKKGISLERVSFQAKTNAPENFKSAAATVGYATPGYENSQINNLATEQNEISLSSKTFSPDNDGFEDLLEINYSFNEATEDVMATVQIYNDNGMLIRKLYNNKRLSRKGTLHWDGMQENNQQAKVGIYIIAIQLYNSKGFNKIIRKSCVLASKF